MLWAYLTISSVHEDYQTRHRKLLDSFWPWQIHLSPAFVRRRQLWTCCEIQQSKQLCCP